MLQSVYHSNLRSPASGEDMTALCGWKSKRYFCASLWRGDYAPLTRRDFEIKW